MEDHVANCPRCQCRLLRLAGGDQWNDLLVSLRDGHDNLSIAAEQVDQCLSADLAEVLRQLNPSDLPESLGRLGTHEIAAVIGSGGMGVVLKAEDAVLTRTVAVKAMLPHLARSGTARGRFAKEARATAAINHENVIPIHAVDMSGPLPYLVMPFIRGESLQQRLDRDGPLELAAILRIGLQVAAGLAAAHAQGVIHRDIKPANILLESGTDRLKITDFGLARAVDDASTTRTGVILGTPQFMSPEQTRGRGIDSRSDLFSLGSLLYMAACGFPAFRSDNTFAVLSRIVSEPAAPVRQTRPDLPEWFERLVSKLMCKRPEDRYQSASEVVDVMQRCLAHVQHPDRQLPRELRHAGRSGRTMIVGGVIVLGLLIGAGWIHGLKPAVISSDQASKPAPVPTPPFDWSDQWLMPLDRMDAELDELESTLQPVSQSLIPTE